MANIKNPIIYIGGPGYSYDHFEPLIGGVDHYFQDILSKLQFVRPDGTPVLIDLKIDVMNPEKVEAEAYRTDREKGIYNIRMTAGLSYYIWLASRVFEVNYNVIPWLKMLKITEPSARRDGRKKIVADFVYFICSYAVLLHELSHVVLGHTDFLADEMGNFRLNEFSEGNDKKMSEKEYRIRNAMEAEADRQSVSFLMIFIDETMGPDGLGTYLRFPSRVMVNELIVYALTILTILLQQLTAGVRAVHPSPDERQYILYSSMASYISKLRPAEAGVVTPKIYLWGMAAAKKLGLRNANEPDMLFNTALKMGQIDEVIAECNLRSYAHSIYIN